MTSTIEIICHESPEQKAKFDKDSVIQYTGGANLHTTEIDSEGNSPQITSSSTSVDDESLQSSGDAPSIGSDGELRKRHHHEATEAEKIDNLATTTENDQPRTIFPMVAANGRKIGPVENGVANGDAAAENADGATSGAAKIRLHPHQKPDGTYQFDPNSYIYMANACCEMLHYRTAAFVVGVLEILMLCGWFVFDVFYYRMFWTDGLAPTLAITAQCVAGAVALTCIGLMFHGLRHDRPYFLWPHMVFQMLGIGLGIVLTVIAVISMAAGTHIADAVFGKIFGAKNLPHVAKVLGPIWPFCLAVIFDFGAAVGIWFYIIVRGAYDYLQDKKYYQKHAMKQGNKNEAFEEMPSEGANDASTNQLCKSDQLRERENDSRKGETQSEILETAT